MKGKLGRIRPYYGNPVPMIDVLSSDSILYSDFTDGTSTSGYYDITTDLPIGAIPIGWKANVAAGFKNSATYTPADGTTIAFVDGDTGDDTITDSADGFVDAGFKIGDVITIAGATTSANNTDYTLTGVAAGTLTMATASIDTAEAGIEGISFTAKTTAVISVGIEGDTDKYSADTARSVAGILNVGSSVLAADAADDMGTAQTVRITVTETTDFTDYDQGTMVVDLYYIKTI